MARSTGLVRLQRDFAHAVTTPLGRGGKLSRYAADGGDLHELAQELVRPNDRLRGVERLELYNRQYWFRLWDCLHDDYPGLRAVLGERRFHVLVTAYLKACPSRSFTLRNLGSKLEGFMGRDRSWRRGLTPGRVLMAREMAGFEWAQAVAFDGERRATLTMDELLGANPAKMRVRLQPYMSLLHLRFPLDDFAIAIKKQSRLEAASQASTEGREEDGAMKSPRLPRPEEVFLVVHRMEETLYYKRLGRQAFLTLKALGNGASVAGAVGLGFAGAKGDAQELVGQIRECFAEWTRLGWLCPRR